MQNGTRNSHHLKCGDVVEVRQPAEILAILDSSGASDAVPFMPEMLPFVGKRFTVSARVEKICDTIGPGGSRRMQNAVFLDDLRCSGSAHDGCQAECRIYWKEGWLVRVQQATVPDNLSEQDSKKLENVARSNTRVGEGARDLVFKCQATEAFRATTPIQSVISPAQYFRELSSGNVKFAHLLRVLARAILWKIGARLGFSLGSRRKNLYAGRSANSLQETGDLRLQPGEWVQVKSADEIASTLDNRGYNRGLMFSPNEMLPACGRRFRVRRRVEKIIDEKSGRMLKLNNSCIVLEGLTCRGDRSPGLWFCHRHVYPYWRESWLRRVYPSA
jgi:hypothetical protein